MSCHAPQTQRAIRRCSRANSEARGARSSPCVRWTADLVPAVAANAAQDVGPGERPPFPLRLIWGEPATPTWTATHDLSIGVAKALRGEKVSRAELHVLRGARHNLQIDRPKRLATLTASKKS